jgi:hypothetical protein
LCPKKIKDLDKCLERFDHAFDDISNFLPIDLLPENTVGSLIQQLPDHKKETKNG